MLKPFVEPSLPVVLLVSAKWDAVAPEECMSSDILPDPYPVGGVTPRPILPAESIRSLSALLPPPLVPNMS